MAVPLSVARSRLAGAIGAASRQMWRRQDLCEADRVVLSLLCEALHRVGALLRPRAHASLDLVLAGALPDIRQTVGHLVGLATPSNAVFPKSEDDGKADTGKIGHDEAPIEIGERWRSAADCEACEIPAAALEAKICGVASCHRGHPLRVVVADDAFECDVCEAPIAESSTMRCCRRCDYSVCLQCHRNLVAEFTRREPVRREREVCEESDIPDEQVLEDEGSSASQGEDLCLGLRRVAGTTWCARREERPTST